MIKKELQKAVFEAVKKGYPKSEVKLEDIEIEKSPRPEYGEWSSNVALKLSKDLRESPQNIAEKIHDLIIETRAWGKIIDESGFNIAGPGFINLGISNKYYLQELTKVLKEESNFAGSDLFKNKKVMVEFISANPTGPLTLANGRGGFSGDVLANVFQKVGAKVTREYYVNDTGKQIENLGARVIGNYHDLCFEEEGKKGLPKYEKMREEEYGKDYIGPYYLNLAQKLKKKIGNSFHKKIEEIYKNPGKTEKEKFEESKKFIPEVANFALEKIILDIKNSISKMGIKFDNYFPEKEMVERGEVEEALEYFKKKGLTYKKEDALWFKTTKFSDDKDRVLIKSDGEKTYFANDSTYHFDKFKKRNFDKVVNLWGADHHGYVERIKAVVTAMGFGEKLDIIIMQLVRLVKDGKEFKMSKRKGTYVTMDDLLELIGGTEKEASDVARFFFLSRAFSTHMDFDLNLAQKRSEKNPVFYVKYAFARLSGILRNAQKLKLPKADLSLLKENEEIDLIKELIKLSEAVEDILKNKDYPVHHLTFYSREIADKFHGFYEKCRVLDENNLELTATRLQLVEATKNCFRNCDEGFNRRRNP